MIRNTALWRLQFLSLIDDLVNSINRLQFLTSFRIAFSILNRLNHITVFDDLIKYIFFSCRLFFINHIKNCFHIICLNGFHQNRLHWKKLDEWTSKWNVPYEGNRKLKEVSSIKYSVLFLSQFWCWWIIELWFWLKYFCEHFQTQIQEYNRIEKQRKNNGSKKYQSS